VRRAGIALVSTLLANAAPSAAALTCAAPGTPVSLEELVGQIESQALKYVFIGERHQNGPAKRFAVDLVNRLVELGYDAGLYVEGFREGCAPRDASCGGLAWLFNREAFAALLDDSLAPVHPLDPREKDGRAQRMASRLGAGREAIRVVLVGNSHVLFAGDAEAEHRVYGGAMRYPDPGDLVEAFPRNESLTLVLDLAEGAEVPYSVRTDGCRADYALVSAPTAAY